MPRLESAEPPQVCTTLGEVELALPAPAPARRRRAASVLQTPAARRGVWTLLDQAVVSGTSFLTTIVVGRFCGDDALGVYALGFTLVVLSAVIHESLVSSPYQVLGVRHQGPRRTAFAAASLRLHFAVTGILLLACALLPATLGDVWRTIAWTLCLVIPGALLRDFARRLALAHLRPELALLCDSLMLAVQAALLVWLALSGRLSASTGLLALGGAGFVAGASMLFWQRRAFRSPPSYLAEDVRTCLRFGRPVLAARVTSVVNSFILHWLLAFQLGAAATGVFAACMTIMQFANPVVLGLATTLGPHAAHAYAEHQAPGLRRVVFQGLIAAAGIMLILCTVLTLSGNLLMNLLYGGGDYAGHVLTIGILALYTFVGTLSICVFQGLMTIHRSDVNFRINLLSLVITLIAAGPLVSRFSLTGAALALLIGCAISTTVQITVFFLLVRKNRPSIEL